MTRYERNWGAMLRSVVPRWNATDAGVCLAMLRQRLRRRATARRIAVGLALVGGAGLAFGFLGGHLRVVSADAAPGAHSSALVVHPSNRPSSARLAPETRVAVIEASPERIITSLGPGQIDVQVALRSSRSSRGVAADVGFEAPGTACIVERMDERVVVSVRPSPTRESSTKPANQALMASQERRH